MLPAHMRGIRQWVFDVLDGPAEKPIPLERIVWSNQDSLLERPYVLLFGTGSSPEGAAPERRTLGDPGSEVFSAVTVSSATVSITVVGVVARQSLDDDADAYVSTFAANAYDYDASSALRSASVGIQRLSVLAGQDRLTGSSQWETRASVDVTVTVSSDARTTPGIVESTSIAGTTEPPTPQGVTEITA